MLIFFLRTDSHGCITTVETNCFLMKYFKELDNFNWKFTTREIYHPIFVVSNLGPFFSLEERKNCIQHEDMHYYSKQTFGTIVKTSVITMKRVDFLNIGEFRKLHISNWQLRLGRCLELLVQ